MVRQSKIQSLPSEILNFHFSTSPPTQQSHAEERKRNNRNGNQNYNKRTDQDRASARKKAQSAMFYLHSSSDHSFVLTRKGKQGYTFSGPDSTVSWESVRLVTYLVTSNQIMGDTPEACPICLDSFSCARITKCGHCFCLPCLLRHVHTAAAVNPYQAVKCPCCGLFIHLDDIRPVVMESIQRPKLQARMRFFKLHRTKDCPAPFLPKKGAMKHSSPHSCPLQTDRDASFSRFNYVEPVAYQMQLSSNVNELEAIAKELHPGEIDLLFVQMSLERVRNEIRIAQEESDEENVLMERFQQPQAGIYQPISRFLSARQSQDTNNHKTFECVPREELKAEEGRLHVDSVCTECDRYGRPNRGYSIDSSGSHEKYNSRKPLRHLPHLPGSMYLDEEATQFYQAADGQLCFLSKFNMQCLSAEFSIHPPKEELSGEHITTLQRRKHQPLPDELDGSIIEIQHIHLTPEMRKRIPFLSHLPLYTDAAFVELDLDRILSEKTKQLFKVELDKRRQRRKDKSNAEKRADWTSKQKEVERINTVKARLQQIDPNDNFFQIPEVELLNDLDFPLVASGDRVPKSPTGRPLSASAITFSAVVNTPSATSVTLEAFPSLGSPLLTVSSSRQQLSWSKGWHAINATEKSLEDQPLEEQLSPRPAQSSNPVGGKGKKSKGKKIHLFSTGGQRGY